MSDKGEIIPSTQDMWSPDPKAKPAPLMELNKKYDLLLLHMKAEDLIGEKFTIFHMIKTPSEMPGVGYYYFCQCADPDSGELFTTTLGGQVIVDILDKVLEKKVTEPFTVLLDFVKSGAHDGYYIFR